MSSELTLNGCNICKLPIDPNGPFANIQLFDNIKQMQGQKPYHIQCLRERMLTNKTVEKEAIQALDMANKLLNELAGKKA